MKILQINNCHYRRGGADAVYLNTINLLKERGSQVVEFSQKSENNEPSDYEPFFVEEFDPLKLSFIKKILFTPRQLYSFETAKKLEKLLSQEKPDVAHIHLYKGVLTVSVLRTLKKKKVPVCITLHDYGLICPRNILFDGDNNICEKCIRGSAWSCVVKRCNRKNLFYSAINFIEYTFINTFFKPERYINVAVPVSKFNLRKHSERKGLKDRLIHLYNFSPELEVNTPRYEKGEYFIFYGRLSNEKGINTLIDAFKQLKHNFKLKIVGAGQLENDLKKRLLDERIENIEMLGYKSGKELNQLIKKSSFIVVPSEWYENNPMTIVEGFSFGKPVIGSDIGGIPELIVEGETGYVFEMANKDDLARKVKCAAGLNAGEYLSMSQNCRKYAEAHFSGAVHYSELLEIYREAIKRNNQ